MGNILREYVSDSYRSLCLNLLAKLHEVLGRSWLVSCVKIVRNFCGFYHLKSGSEEDKFIPQKTSIKNAKKNAKKPASRMRKRMRKICEELVGDVNANNSPRYRLEGP